MNFVRTPISYSPDDTLTLSRQIKSSREMLDNLIELIVFTPRGTFAADSDFGFEYWNHEYANVDSHAFNSGQNGSYVNGINNEITKRDCQDSIKRSLEIYEPLLKGVDVQIELLSIENDYKPANEVRSKRNVVIVVTGMLDDGLGTFLPYKKEVSFYMEPTVKRN